MEFIFSNTDFLILQNYSCLDKNQRTSEMGGSIDMKPKGTTKLKVLPNKIELLNNILPLS